MINYAKPIINSPFSNDINEHVLHGVVKLTVFLSLSIHLSIYHKPEK